jgi:hypothetical protein
MPFGLDTSREEHAGLLDQRAAFETNTQVPNPRLSVVPFKAGEKRSMETSLISNLLWLFGNLPLLLAKDARDIIGQYLFAE